MAKKIILWTVVVLILVLTGGYFSVQHLLNRVIVDESTQLKLAHLKQSTKVYKDKWGIPHIYAQNDVDAYRTLGYMIASERLFQMDIMRRITAGRLSEVLGDTTVKIDILLRKLKIRKTMEEYFEKNKNSIDPHILRLSSAFFDGVDQYVKNNPLPIEFVILGYEPEPFTIVDSMGVSGYMALSFAEALVGDVLFADLAKDVSATMLNELRVGPSKYFKEKGYTKNSNYLNKSKFLKNVLEGQDFLSSFFFMFHGSNSWAISGRRSDSGKPILANDPHIAYSNPSVWYEAHINTPDFELYGHYLPLVPFAGLGHNTKKAWALTISELDDFDLFIEKINPKNPDQYLYKGEWVNFDIDEQVIKVKGKDDVKIEVKTSIHGPLIDGTKHAPKDKSVALSWSYHLPENDVITSFYKLGRAVTNSEFKEAISHATAPGLNITWVNHLGDIGWWVMGRIPKRAKGIESDVLLEGWHGKHDYQGYYKFEENPHDINPKSGILISANFKPVYDQFMHFDGYWQPSDRYERINELLSSRLKWNLGSLKKVQTDLFNPYADGIKQILLKEVSTQDSYEKKILSYLKDWDGNTFRQSVGASIYYVWNTHIMQESLIDEMGEDRFSGFSRIADYWHFFKEFIYNEDSGWWNNVKTKKIESRNEIVNISFRKTIKFLKEKLGDDVSKWYWGGIHTLELEHPLGKVKPLDKLFNIGPYPAPGSFSVVNNLSFKRGTLNYASHLGPSTRRLIDMGNPLTSLGILPTGNSGHVNSKHYADQTQRYLNGEYRFQLLREGDIKKASEIVLDFSAP